MTQAQDKLQLRQIGRGFIVCNEGDFTGRRLTKAYMDQHKRTYVKINGQMELLTDQHNYLAVD